MEFHRGFCVNMGQDLKPNNQEELQSCIILSMFNKAAVQGVAARPVYERADKKGFWC